MLLDLLSYDSAQVRTYVHACLYALFSRRAIREEADMLGAESELRVCAVHCRGGGNVRGKGEGGGEVEKSRDRKKGV